MRERERAALIAFSHNAMSPPTRNVARKARPFRPLAGHRVQVVRAIWQGMGKGLGRLIYCPLSRSTKERSEGT